ncbi:MAG: ATP-dependent helicase, partial [Rubrobacter sp.]|nr:ATP-dependent helicase [Rubrobacter sp.]
MIELSYESGTLISTSDATTDGKPPEPFVWDKRTEQWRAPASSYRETVLKLRETGTPYTDRAARFEKLSLESRVAMEPRPYQREALNAWRKGPSELRGVVVLPT